MRYGDLPIFRFRRLSNSRVRHGVTGRVAALPAKGDISFATGPDPATVRANRAAWCEAIGVDAGALVFPRQVHGTHVALIDDADAGRGADTAIHALPATDAMLTDRAGIPLAVVCADCTPILLHDPVQGVVGAVHAGWRGTVQDVAGVAVRTMVEEYGCRSADIVAGIGPAIGPCCYEVGPEVIGAWQAVGLDPENRAVIERAPRPYFNLWEANRIALVAVGVQPDNIEVAGVCTRCHGDRFFSHRARQEPPGRFAAIIALAPETERIK